MASADAAEGNGDIKREAKMQKQLELHHHSPTGAEATFRLLRVNFIHSETQNVPQRIRSHSVRLSRPSAGPASLMYCIFPHIFLFFLFFFTLVFSFTSWLFWSVFLAGVIRVC